MFQSVSYHSVCELQQLEYVKDLIQKEIKKLYTVEDEEVEFKTCVKVDLLFTQEQLN